MRGNQAVRIHAILSGTGHRRPLHPAGSHVSVLKAKGFRFCSKFIELAQSTNDNMPYYVINKTATILNEYAKSIKRSNILLLGMAYKPDISDLRESPGLEVYEQFKENGAYVDYYDPYAHSFVDKQGGTVRAWSMIWRNSAVTTASSSLQTTAIWIIIRSLRPACQS